DLEGQRRAVPEEQLYAMIEQQPPPVSLAAALSAPRDTPRIIAEIKRASPSRGLIRADFPVGDLATALADAAAYFAAGKQQPLTQNRGKSLGPFNKQRTLYTIDN
ncbi:MAG: hypothetical protein EOM14_08835, partial [Clostridia bacterium]|nr:hypothetical protein [Clostridia bacterium]